MNLGINIGSFLSTLPIMGKGMLGIFAVTVIIVAVMMLLNSFASGNSDK